MRSGSKDYDLCLQELSFGGPLSAGTLDEAHCLMWQTTEVYLTGHTLRVWKELNPATTTQVSLARDPSPDNPPDKTSLLSDSEIGERLNCTWNADPQKLLRNKC